MTKKTKATGKPWTSTSGNNPKWDQSPIDISNHVTQEFPILLMQNHLDSKCVKMTNTGKTVKIELCSQFTPLLKGGPLDGEYLFSDLQFRWGPSDALGSEHSIDSRWYSIEAQLVHWNKKYGSPDKCYDKSDGMAIMSFLFQVVDDPCAGDSFRKISDGLKKIRAPGANISLEPDSLNWLEQAMSSTGYYTYFGSLTTEPFTECVQWIIVPRPILIIDRQSEAFRDLYDYDMKNITSNYRPLQRTRYTGRVYWAIQQKSQSVVNCSGCGSR
ncbi:hypothetical protein TKK_0011415 [Trichogramma kaykai]|uniref:Alpha-carbonic anhydrase domain-containing protein n=1 Tax=Trichogramma kaykai TaxID=54128 RepID=A0ABD2WSK4_9HYME